MLTCIRILEEVVSLLILFLTSLCAAASAGKSQADEVQAGAGEDGKQLQLSLGQMLEVTLDLNKTTGYSWEIASLEGAALRSSGEPEYLAPSGVATTRMGAGGSQVFRFQAASAGTAELQLVYRRPWQKDSPPARTYHLTVVVS